MYLGTFPEPSTVPSVLGNSALCDDGVGRYLAGNTMNLKRGDDRDMGHGDRDLVSSNGREY
jgi:hypothetical protein